MLSIIDKTIIIILSFIMLYMGDSSVSSVVALLITVFFAAINSYLEGKKVLKITTCLFGSVSLFFSPLFNMSPAIIYDTLGCRGIVAGVIFAVSAIVNLRAASMHEIIYFVILIALVYIMNSKSKRNVELEQMVKEIRDDGQEKNLLLTEKNRYLLDKQDYEVYVATLRERNRIAREIHDNVGHIITRSILQMGALMTINKNEPIFDQLSSVKDNLDMAMNNMRESVHDLHDESIDLEQTLRELASGLDESSIFRLDYDVTSRIDRRYKYAIIGIIREAISNIIKHSKNDMVEILIREHPGMYQIVIYDYDRSSGNRVSDDKTGSFGMNKNMLDELISMGGIGIQNIRDRVKLLNGNISISMEAGFKIFITLPRDDEEVRYEGINS